MDLRVGDIVAINKQAKAWLYADLLEKPEELLCIGNLSKVDWDSNM